MMPTTAPRLGLQAAWHGVLWSLVQAWGVRTLTLLHFVLIARLLAPADLGLVALATALVACFATVVDQGMGPWIERHAQATPTELDTAWWTASVSGLAVSGLIAALAPSLALLTGKAYLAALLPVLGSTVFIAALGSTQTAWFKAHFQHKQLAVASLVSTVVGTAVGLTAAWLGAAVWALVLKAVVEACITTAWLVATCAWRPGRHWQAATWRQLLGQSWPVLGMRLLDIANQRLDSLLVGSRLGAVALGYYSTGQRIYQIAMEALFSAVNQVALPVFGRVSTAPNQAGQLLLRIVRLTSLVTMPAFAVAAASGSTIVAVVFGPRWLEAGPVFSAFCVGGLLFAVSYFNAPLLIACGRSRAVLGLTVLNAVTNACAFWWAVPHGALAVALAFVVRGYLVYPVNLLLVRHTTGLRLRDYARALGPAAVGSALAAAAAQATLHAVADPSAPAACAAALAAGLLAYLLALRALFPATVQAAWHELRALRAAPSTPQAAPLGA